MVLPTVFRDAAVEADRLAERTSLGVGGRPEFLFEPATLEEAAATLASCRRAGVPVRILGGGYNLLVGDDPLAGAVIATRRLRRKETAGDAVRVEAGYPFPDLVRRSVRLGLPVLPGCPGIPGTVGGVVATNAGGRDGSVGDALHQVDGLDERGRRFRRRVRAADFSYRTSAFEGGLVLRATFRRDGRADPEADARRYRDALAAKRRTQPLSAKSAGCVFKNPDGPAGGPSAGRLIEAAGLKGRRVGGAVVSTLHANFILNDGGATAADVRELICLVQRDVQAFHGIRLALEVRVWD